jgi:hypothetical protein
MGIYYIFIVSKSGGLIFNYDHNLPQLENEKVSLVNPQWNYFQITFL